MFIVQYINNKVLFALLIYVANQTFIVIKYRKCGRRVYNTYERALADSLVCMTIFIVHHVNQCKLLLYTII